MINLKGDTDAEKLSFLGKQSYKEQAVWFLNAYWEKFDVEKHADDIWTWTNKFQELDKKGAEGCELDEFQAHRFLESIGEILTVKKMREVLKEIDLDFNKYVSLIEFIVYKFKEDGVTVNTLVNVKPANSEEIMEAQKLLEGAQKSLGNARNKAESARKAEVAAKAAETENKRCLKELHTQEELYNGKIAAFEAIATDDSKGIVKRNRAKAEMASLKAEDPLPLRRAKINQGAAVRKSQRASNAAIDASKAAEDALILAEAAFQEAEDFLLEVKSRKGSAAGALWWIERELTEAKKYLPLRKGGIARK